MEPLSNSRIELPSVKVSVRAGIRPLGFISKNQSSFWVFLPRSILVTCAEDGQAVLSPHALCAHSTRFNTSYFNPSSSRRIDTLMPLGVWAV